MAKYEAPVSTVTVTWEPKGFDPVKLTFRSLDSMDVLELRAQWAETGPPPTGDEAEVDARLEVQEYERNIDVAVAQFESWDLDEEATPENARRIFRQNPHLARVAWLRLMVPHMTAATAQKKSSGSGSASTSSDPKSTAVASNSPTAPSQDATP